MTIKAGQDMQAMDQTTLDRIDTPALVLDRGRMDRNIARMRAKTDALGVALRPHLKTTKSADIARRAVREGGGITVSTLREAEYFAGHGFDDIFYAVAIVPQKLARVAALMRRGVRMLLAVDHPAAARFVADGGRALGVTFEVLIEIDSGEGRSGIEPDAPVLLEIAQALGAGATPAGVFTHGGHSYSGRTDAEHAAVAEQERSSVAIAAGRLRAAGHTCAIVSIGSTPSVAHARDLSGVTEVRAGVYVLGDLFQASIGGCGQDDLAVSVLTTVIGNHPDRQQIVIDAGSLALSKDVSTSKLGEPDNWGYGMVVDADSGQTLHGLYVQIAYQEHGILKSLHPIAHADFPIGRRLRILPNHACLTSAAYDRYHVVADGGTEIEAVWPRINGW